MPLVKNSTYKSTPWLINGHFQTIYPALTRKVAEVKYERERIKTPDDDFLDLDWSTEGSDTLTLISHGLEGSTDRHYMQGMARVFNDHGFDALTWNYRGCGEEMNHQRIFYHSGATYDLETVVKHVTENRQYKKLFLIGFSLGGNLTLKYLGEKGNDLPDILKGAIVYSVPLDLHASCIQISMPSNFLYARRFLKSLMQKVKAKAAIRDDFHLLEDKKIRTLMEFDDVYTAPMHGFEGAIDYYNKCSSINFIENIKVPTLVVNAKNDPFLAEACYPEHIFTSHKTAFFESPDQGGHVGFHKNGKAYYWSELRAIEFLRELQLI